MLAVVAIVAALTTVAIPRIQDAIERARVARAIGDIRVLQADLKEQDSLPASLSGIGRAGLLDPWGHPYQYLRFPDGVARGAVPGARLDRFMVPLNDEFDLYSLGKNGQTAAAITSSAGQDDVVRAVDGGFIGLAARF